MGVRISDEKSVAEAKCICFRGESSRFRMDDDAEKEYPAAVKIRRRNMNYAEALQTDYPVQNILHKISCIKKNRKNLIVPVFSL